MLCREYETPGIKEVVARSIGKVTKGDIVDFVDFYCATIVEEGQANLTVNEQQMLLTELWNWREQHANTVWG